jgi:uncharacterized protein YcbK (DUF882 family)
MVPSGPPGSKTREHNHATCKRANRTSEQGERRIEKLFPGQAWVQSENQALDCGKFEAPTFTQRADDLHFHGARVLDHA